MATLIFIGDQFLVGQCEYLATCTSILAIHSLACKIVTSQGFPQGVPQCLWNRGTKDYRITEGSFGLESVD